MRCRKAKNLLTAFLDGELAPGTHEQVRAHLEGCEACRREQEVLERVRHAVEEMEAPRLDPAVSADAILHRARVEAGREEAKGVRWTRQLPAAAPVGLRPALALVAGLAVVGILWVVPFLRSVPVPADRDVFLAERMDLFENLDLIRDLSLLEHLEAEAARGAERG